MKTNKLTSIVLLTALFTGACKQSPIVPVAPEVPVVETPDKGDADFSKFVALGDSYVAGAQGGTLFDASMAASLPKILATQFALAGGGAFNQPDVNHVNGLNFVVFAGTGGAVSTGRYLLFDPDGDVDPDGTGCATSRSAAPRSAGSPLALAVCPSTNTTPAMPSPYDTFQTLGALLAFTGDKALLNNFGVPGTRVFHTTAAAYGAAPPTGSPWYFRIASAPGTSTLLGDAASKGHKFFLMSMGLFDVGLYASGGATGNINGFGSNDMTPQAAFEGAWDFNLSTMLTDPAAKGVVTTIPDIISLPFFNTVTWNAIAFSDKNCSDATTIAGLNGLFGGYNGALDFLASPAAGNAITPEEAAKRKVVYGYGKNPVLLEDETLTDVGATLNAISPALAKFGKTRPATATDIILLTAGSALGTCAGSPAPGIPISAPPTGVPTGSWIYGVSAPLPDQYAIIPIEYVDIQARTLAFNTKIKDAAIAANASTVRVAVADINKEYNKLLTDKVYAADGVTITPTFAPPAGMFSEDGIHPNSRGYAFTANVVIDAINAAFNAKVPKASLAAYTPTALPIKGQ